VIFIDDASQEGYASNLQKLLQRELHLPYRIISHPLNKGLAGARNTGLNAANTEYVINVDSDDVPLNDFVRNIVHRLDA
ncbi:glycosyltransferase, partial [Acinetobacter baumannii]